MLELNKIHNMNCIEGMKLLPDNSIDAIITDPPYEIGFMGKGWDSTGIANNVDMRKECLRVLKPGGHLLSFAATRTYHRMTCAIEDAGFDVRDMIEWVYGSGFPKSLNIGKAVDKIQGNEREVVGKDRSGSERNCMAGDFAGGEYDLTKGTSEWEGWGTALKPAHEPICMARKPLEEKTIAENCLKYGAGGINIDESRVGTEVMNNAPAGSYLHNNVINDGRSKDVIDAYIEKQKTQDGTTATGRFPANLIHDNSEEVRECFPESKSKGHFPSNNKNGNSIFNTNNLEQEEQWLEDSGNASRFFKSIIYQSKASKSDRGEGNTHSTVKPTALMEYLIKMVTKEGYTVLDPFMGSGTTALACKNINRKFIGFELEKEYVEIANARIKEEQVGLFTM